MENPELTFWKQWIKGPYPWLGSWKTCRDTYLSQEIPPVSSRKCEITEFCNSKEEWSKIYEANVRGKICVDVGVGCDGMVPFWKDAKKRILIDPLVDEYHKLIQEESVNQEEPDLDWFSGCELVAIPAQEACLKLRDSIDGTIVFRNAMDHDTDSVGLLKSVLSLAMPGCLVIFWSELIHKTEDVGHYSVPLSETDIMQLFSEFTILRRFKAVHGPNYICKSELGLLAIRK
jgi:hypothetical protein